MVNLHDRRSENRETMRRLAALFHVHPRTMYRFAALHGLRMSTDQEIIEAWVRLKSPSRIARFGIVTKAQLEVAVSVRKLLAPCEAAAFVPPEVKERKQRKYRKGTPLVVHRGRAMSTRDIAEYLWNRANIDTPPDERYTIPALMSLTYARIARGWQGERLLLPPSKARRPDARRFLLDAYAYEGNPPAPDTPVPPKSLRLIWTRALWRHTRTLLRAMVRRSGTTVSPEDLDALMHHLVTTHGWPPMDADRPKWGGKGLKGPLWSVVADPPPSNSHDYLAAHAYRER